MKKLLLTVLSAVLMLGMIVALASCGDDPVTPPDNDNNTPGGDSTVPSTVYIVKDGVTAYSLAYSAEAEDYAYLLYYEIEEMGAQIDFYECGDDTAGNEIVIGDTDRQISVDLKAAAEAIKTADGDFVWAYGYKDGKLGFYANSALAFEIGFADFTSEIVKDSAVECKDNLWVTGIKTYQEYQEELDAEMEAQDKVVENQIVKKLAKFSASYTSKWGSDFTRFPTSYNTTIKPQTSHPRVWVNSDSLDAVISNLTASENLSTYNSVKLVAERALLENGGMTKADTKELATAIEKIEALAFMYLTTGREKYGYAAILQSFYLIDTISLPDSNGLYLNSNYAGSTVCILSEVYDWCYDLFTADQRKSFVVGTCNNIAKYFEIGYPPKENATSVSGHDAETGILRNWLIFGIAVYNEYPEIYNFTAGKIIDEYVPAADFYYASGSHHQGSAYGTSPRLYSNIASSLLMLAATGEDIYSSDLGAVIMTHINRIRPDGEPLRIGDDFNRGGSSYNMNNGLMQLAFYAGSVYKDPVAKAWFNDANVSMSYNRGHMELTPVIFLIYNDPGVIAGSKYDLELTHYNPAPLGAVVTRSAWGDPAAWLTYTNIEIAFEGNHDHRDAGTFQIYYKGILAPDTGAYEYSADQGYNSSYDHTYAKLTLSKNGLLIYNPNMRTVGNWVYSGGQSFGAIGSNGDYGNKDLDEWEASSTINQAAVLGYSSGMKNGESVYTYISGDITKAYDAATVDLVVRSTMTLATGNDDVPMAFIVYDRIVSKDASFEKSFVLHTTNKPVFGNGQEGTEITSSVTGQKNWVGFKKVTGTSTFYYNNVLGPDGAYAADDPNDKYDGQLTVQTLLPEDPTYYYVGGDGKRFWLNGRNTGKEYTTERPIAEIGWGRVEIAPSTQQKDDTFLNVMYASDAGTAVTEQAQIVSGSTTHDGVVTYGSCVMFARADECALKYSYSATDAERKEAIQSTLISGTVSFDTTGKAQGDLNYYVTGLAEGTWTVSVGGVTKTVTVTAEGAIAIFEAPAGQVTMTKAQ